MKNINKQQELEGLGVSPGIAIGTVYKYDSRSSLHVREIRIAESKVERERNRLIVAALKASEEIGEIRDKTNQLKGAAREELGYLLEAYQHMLKGSRLIRGVEKRINEERINAEAAVQKEISVMEDAFAKMNDSYLSARIEDIREVGNRLIRSLGQGTITAFSSLPHKAIIVTNELSPADIALLNPDKVSGVTTIIGGIQSHTSIMAKSLLLPLVVSPSNLLKLTSNGDSIIIDGSSGKIYLNPDIKTLILFRRKRAKELRNQKTYDRLRSLIPITQDGTSISLQANIELPSEIPNVIKSGASGIGLLRTEFMFMNRNSLPTEEEQFNFLREIITKMEGRPVTIRTLDVGNDKLSDGLEILSGPNPALGLRAIRFSLKKKKILEDQLRAIVRSSIFGPIRILLPMVTNINEIITVKEIITDITKQLYTEMKIKSELVLPLGIMIEVPAAALQADLLAKYCDFFAIGTNDLTQYTLAIDRTDETVAHLFNPQHPSVLKLIEMSAKAAIKANIPVSVCGEIAGEESLTEFLISIGILELSMVTNKIPRIKKKVRSLNLIKKGN